MSTGLQRLGSALVLGSLLALTGCMEVAPVPDWVYPCHDAQAGPECAPDDAKSQVGADAN